MSNAAVKSIDRNLLKKVNTDVSKALDEIAQKYGLKYQHKSGSFDEHQFTGRFQFCVVAEGGLSAGDKEEFELYASRFGLAPDMFGKTYQEDGFTYTVAGLNLRAPKNCVRLERCDGASYKCSADYAKMMLQKNG